MNRLLASVFLLLLASSAYAQFYDVYIVRANDSEITNLVYDDASWSYADNSMENPDASVRICTANSGDLLNKWVALAYADGSDGDYIEVSSWPLKVGTVAPNGCAAVPLDVDSFNAWYPSIPYVFIADDAALTGASRWKLSKARGWFVGNYTLTTSQVGNNVDITVTDALDDTATSILPDVPYLVVGLVRPDFTTMDTVISSPNDLETLLSDGGNYTIFINGIGPDLAPFVVIYTPQATTYTTQSIPFTYSITDDDGVSACWYVLDGVNNTMPDCTSSFILNAGPGTHTLTLYANDTMGQLGSDSVTFSVSGAAPPPSQGGGGTKTPYPQPPVVPPPPPGVYFSIEPENIYVVINYPYEGIEHFSLTSSVYMYDLDCFVVSDFGEYTTVDLDSDVIGADSTLRGTITVSMSPQEILDYNQGMSGYLQCVGRNSPSLQSSTLANVFLIINKPFLEMDNQTYSALPGELFNGTAPIWNMGPGNATVVNVTAMAVGVPYEVRIDELPGQLGPGEQGLIRFSIDVPDDMPEGISTIEVQFFENGRPIGKGYILVRVLPKPPGPPGEVCRVPDLMWTIVILLLAVLSGMIMFRKKLEGEKDAGESAAEKRYQYQNQA